MEPPEDELVSVGLKPRLVSQNEAMLASSL